MRAAQENWREGFFLLQIERSVTHQFERGDKRRSFRASSFRLSGLDRGDQHIERAPFGRLADETLKDLARLGDRQGFSMLDRVMRPDNVNAPLGIGGDEFVEVSDASA